MQEIINLIINNGIGVVCVAYLIYFNSTTLKNMLKTLETINIRLSIIENLLNSKGVKSDEIK